MHAYFSWGRLKKSMIVLQNKGSLELIILIWLHNLNIAEKCKCLQHKFLYIEFKKHIYYSTKHEAFGKDYWDKY